MGFLDKLLGRGKDTAAKTKDVAGDVGDKAQETYEDTKAKISGDNEPSTTTAPTTGSEVGQAEERLDDVRDQTMKDQGRTP